jgi:hypothetical protein
MRTIELVIHLTVVELCDLTKSAAFRCDVYEHKALPNTSSVHAVNEALDIMNFLSFHSAYLQQWFNVKLSLCLIKHHAMKTYRGTSLHALLTRH